jgi:hypothetical protein
VSIRDARQPSPARRHPRSTAVRLALALLIAAAPVHADRVAVLSWAPAAAPAGAAPAARALGRALAQRGDDVVEQPVEQAARRRAQGAVPRERLRVHATARQLRDQGWRSYLAVEAEAAVAALFEARQLVAGVLDLPGTSALLADIALRLGAVHLHLGQGPAAAQAFDLAVALDPGRRLGVAEFAPEVVAAHTRALAAAPGVRRAALHVAARPSGAVVRVDGGPPLPTPAELDLSPGEHAVLVTAPGHLARSQLVIVAPAPAPAARLEVELAVDPVARALGPESRQLGPGGEPAAAAATVAATLLHAELDALFLVAPVWHRGRPALLGQRCAGQPLRCTAVKEQGYRRAGELAAAAAALIDALQAARGADPQPNLLIDARLTMPEPGPSRVAPAPSRPPAWRPPWLWIGLGSAAVLFTTALLWPGDEERALEVRVDPCEFVGPEACARM